MTVNTSTSTFGGPDDFFLPDYSGELFKNLLGLYFIYLEKGKMNRKLKKLLKQTTRELKYSVYEFPKFFHKLKTDKDALGMYFQLHGIDRKDYVYSEPGSMYTAFTL